MEQRTALPLQFMDTSAHNSSMPVCYLSLGTNLGDREGNLREGIAALGPVGVQVKRISSMYETEPVDYLDQPWFLNCVLEAETSIESHALLRELRAIEARLGSKKEFAKGPRKLDLDILLYGSETIATEDLQIPHPRMLQRRFVLEPLVEIAPNLRHPSWSGSVSRLLEDLEDSSQVRRLKE